MDSCTPSLFTKRDAFAALYSTSACSFMQVWIVKAASLEVFTSHALKLWDAY